ncbi:MAG: hypothetical protein AB8I08_31285 [Sandaracinaceae bacterium]
MRRLLPLTLTVFTLAGCGNATPAPSADPAPEPEEATEPLPEPLQRNPTCEEQRSAHRAPFESLPPAVTACEFDHECVSMPVDTPCGMLCPMAIHTAQRAAFPTVEGNCVECDRQDAECARSTPRCHEGHCVMDEGDPPLRAIEVPEANRPGQDPPPARPTPGDAEQDAARRLLAAIYADDPSLAQDFFFPREAFAQVKAIADPDGYWQRLYARFATDVHALHASLALESEPELVGLDIIRRGGWVPRGEEGNALPYWVSRHSQLRYRVAGEERQFEVRVLITWGDRWYITHLSEFH